MRKVLAAVLAFLLTGTLICFVLAYTLWRAVAPVMQEGGMQVSDAVIREEKQLAAERIRALADLYGFDAEPVEALVTEDLLRDLNEQASEWWSVLLNEGRTGEEPDWDTEELEQVLLSDPKLRTARDMEQTESRAVTAAEEVRGSIIRLVLPMRQQTIRLGFQEAGKRLDVPNLIGFLIGTPWTLLALSALLAGLIALICFRKTDDILQFIGSALGAAAIVVLAVMALLALAGIGSMVQEASGSLAILFGQLFSAAMIRIGVLALLMAAGCAVMLSMNGRRGKTA